MKLAPLLLTAAVAAAAAAPAPKRVAFATDDGWTISADYRAPRRGGFVVILAHGVGSSKSEWSRLSEALSARGIGTLAIDLRGHADSRRGPGGERGYETFDASGEWPKAKGDLLAAEKWLKGRGIPESRIAFGGASIGANLAADAAERVRCRTFVVLLSPGADYHGVMLDVPAYAKVLIGASPGDAYADQTRQMLARLVPNVETFSAPSGHGVQMFDDPATLKRVASWIERAAAAPR
jgi:alpha-beta hydrolase superfamily lysophospholipase